MSTLCLYPLNPPNEPRLHFVGKMWKFIFTFACGITVVSSLNVSLKANGRIDQTMNLDHVTTDTPFPLFEMDHDIHNDLVEKIPTMITVLERHAAEVVEDSSSKNTKIVENYINKTYHRVLDSKTKIYLKISKILDPIKRSRPSSVPSCWRFYKSLVTAGGAVKVAAENCGKHYLHFLANISSSILRTLKDKKREILKDCELIRHCKGESCQKSAEKVISKATEVAKELLMTKLESISRFSLNPETQLDDCVDPIEIIYEVKRDTAVENTQHCQQTFGF